VSILQHEIWPVLRPFVHIEIYGRDGGPQKPRWRIEVKRPQSGIVLRQLLGARMPCVACGVSISPVRERAGDWGALYFAPTCPLEVRFGCARGKAAREEYRAVKAEMGRLVPGEIQGSLL